MKSPALLRYFFVAALLGISRGKAGTIAGTIRGAPPAVAGGGSAGGGSYDSRRYKFVEKFDYEALRDFLVYVDEPMSELLAAGAKPAPLVMSQKEANFEPRMLPIVVGSTVRWPNEDEIFHNVFSMSESKEFDLGFYKKDKVPEVVFDRAGRVDVFCAIHSKMHCVIMVLPNRFFAKSDDKGRFMIKGLPAGTFKVRAWHERLPAQTRLIEVAAEGEMKIEFTLGVGQKMAP